MAAYEKGGGVCFKESKGVLMKSRQVTQYICEFCNKRTYTKQSMANHEANCTMNPNRGCRMCLKGLAEGGDMSRLLPLMPDPIWNDSGDLENLAQINEAIEKVRKECGDCPACILATLRQKRIPSYPTDFNYKYECERFWKEYNDN